MPALEEMEEFSLDGVDYEAFNTSGGLGTLCETLAGTVENLNYKTVRYPGHRDIVKMLVRDLRLGQRRDILKDVLETAIPITYQDVVLVFVTVTGNARADLTQESYAKKVYAGDRRQADERDPDHDRRGHLRDGRHDARRQAARQRLRAAGAGGPRASSSPTGSGSITPEFPRPDRRPIEADVVVDQRGRPSGVFAEIRAEVIL